MQAVTQELREQATLLRSTRDEIRSLKEPLMMKPNDSELDVKKVCENNSRERIIEIQQVPAQSQLDEVPQKVRVCIFENSKATFCLWMFCWSLSLFIITTGLR